MMRKTYMSKKYSAGGLDRRDMLSTVDEKSSAFDAFYIQNIKQTKRELSSIGSSNHHGVASNRVRKRKYVKRIVKEIETSPRELMSTSVFLTPDKSLRVNKPLDPFDQLLNSSPVRLEAKQTIKEDPFDKLLVRKESNVKLKSYNKKKARIIKKYNCSSSSETDKENNDNVPQNTTDIKSHQLQIEKESTPSPKIDDSINQFVKNLSLLNNLKRKSIGSVKKSYQTRLTRNWYSPTADFEMSPLSSTPMNNKQRSKSIYKFSPIPMSQLEDSPRHMTINEEDEKNVIQNKSIIFVPKNLINSLKIIKSQSPPAHHKNKSETKTSKPLFSSDEMESLNPERDECSIQNKEMPDSDDKNLDTNGITCLQTSETEPFVGFGNEINDSIASHSIIIPLSFKKSSKSNSERSSNTIPGDDATLKKNNVRNESLVKMNNENDEEVNEQKEKGDGLHFENTEMEFVFTVNSKNGSYMQETAEVHVSNSELTEPGEPFLGFAANDNNKIIFNDMVHDSSANSEPSTFSNVDSINSFDNLTTKGKDDANSTYNSENLEDVYTSEDQESLNSEDIEKESLYDTCNSEQSSMEDESKEIIKEPEDAVDGLNDSVIEKSCDILAPNSTPTCLEVEQTECQKLLEEPVVVVTALNYSVFEKYFDKMVHHEFGNESINTSDIGYGEENSEIFDEFHDSIEESMNDSDYEKVAKSFEGAGDSFSSLENAENSYSNLKKLDGTGNGNCSEYSLSIDNGYNEELQQNQTIDDDTDTIVPNDYEKRCFINTRRRKDPARSLSLISFEDSNASVSSTNKTVLSYKCDILETSGQDNDLVKDSAMNDSILKNINIENKENTDLNKINRDSQNVSDSDSRKSFVTIRKSSKLPRIGENSSQEQLELDTETKPAIVLQPGKKWERSLSIYRRMTMANDNFDQSVLDVEDLHMKGRKYRQSVISMMEMQDCKGTLQNDSIQSRRSTITCKPSRSTIRILKDNSSSRVSLSSTSTDLEDLRGFLEDCDDTIIELSKLNIDENEVTVLEKFNEQSRVVATAREYVLRRCNQTEPLLFDECYPDILLKNCRKIGEGVYGEVYLWRAPDGRARVMKVVPIAGSLRVNGECQKDYHEIISEIVIAMELSALRAPIAEIECHFDEGKDVDELDLHAVENATDVFNEVLAVRCVFGNYPNRLLDLWDLYDECKGSENDNPAVLPRDQQYIVLELANAGEDLESYQFGTAEQAYSLLLQVAFGLAVGEESLQFEHRDLHWGNVLIAPTEQKYATFILRGRSHRVLRRGVAATIIDYSLSRVSLPVGGAPCALYNDLGHDESLFGAVGDYQFEVYRLMRHKLGNEWMNFEPYTNVLWLHYLVDKMITSLRYKRPSTKVHKQYITKLKAVKERVLTYGSAVQFVLTDQEF